MSEVLVNINLNERSKADEEFQLDFEGWVPGGGASDYVRDGNYRLRVVSCVPQGKKGGGGMNAHVVLMVDGPENSPDRSKRLVCYHPLPMGNPQSPENKNKRFLNSLIYSIKTGKRIKDPGSVSEKNPEGLRFPTADEVKDVLSKASIQKFTFAALEGKTCYARVIEDMYNGNQIGKVQGYISREDYERAPGAFGTAAKDDDSLESTRKSAGDAMAKTEKPEKAEKAEKSGKDAVSDALGI